MISEVWRAIKKHRWPLSFLSLTWGLFFILLFARSVSFVNGNLVVGHENLWSDWALHIGMVNIFATKSPADWFLYHPIYAGGKFTYPFVANLISAMGMRLGLGLIPALILPSIFLSFILLFSAYFLLYRLLKSSVAAVLAISIFFLSSGPGFINYFADLLTHFSWDALFYPPRDYSVLPDYGWGTGNVITGMLYPQRAFLLGMPMAILAILSLFEGFKIQRRRLTAFPGPNAADHRKYFAISAILFGLLPICHMHSLLAFGIALLILLYANSKNRDFFFYFYLPLAILSLGLFFIFIQGGIKTRFFSWMPGWNSNGGFFAWINMWWQLWGLMLPAAVIGFVLFWRDARNLWEEKMLGLSFFGMFLLGNLILFQPIGWDNTKIFLWSYFFFSAFAARVIYELWQNSRKGYPLYTRILFGLSSLIIFLFLSLTGLIECIRLPEVSRHSHIMVTKEDIELATQIRNETRVDAVFATAPEHNHPITVFGARSLFLGYTGWAFNFGFPVPQREEELRRIFLGGKDAEKIIADRAIDYVVIGPSEISRYQVNENFFSCRYELKFRNLNYRVYDVRGIKEGTSCVN